MLLDAGVAPESCSAARAIGYRQALAQLHMWRDDPVTIDTDSLVCLSRTAGPHVNVLFSSLLRGDARALPDEQRCCLPTHVSFMHVSFN